MAIFTSIATAIFAGTALAGTFIVGATAFALQVAAGIGLSLIAQAVAGKKKTPDSERAQFSVQGRLQAGGDIPRSFILGWGCTAGSLVYANTWGTAGGTPNAYLTQVIALSDLPVQGLSQFWVNGELCTPLWGDGSASQGYPVLEYRRDGADHLWVRFYDGSQADADPFLVGTFAASERPYAATRIGVGVAYAIVTARVHEDLFSGFPTFRFAMDGVRLFDPSRGTWGGDGDHLPAVQVYNLLRGITFAGEWFYGLQGMTDARLPVASLVGEIEKCRAPIAGPAGMEPTYRAGGEIHVSAPLGDAIEALLTGCQGRLSETGGDYKLHVGEPGSPVIAFGDGDILSTEEQSFTPFFGLAETINGIAAKHPSPEEGWATKVAPPLYRNDLEALAGNRRLLADVSLDLVPYAGQAQRLMKSALAEAQRARRHTIVLPPRYWTLEPGDIVAWTSARNGYVSKLFRVDGVVDRANLDVMVDLTEVDPSDYDWDQGADYRPPVFAPVGPIRPPPQPMVGWQAFPAVIVGDGGMRRPSLEVRFDGNQDDVSDIWVQARLASNAAFVYDGQLTYGTPSPGSRGVILNGVFLPRTHYQARGRFVATSGRPTEWSEWLDVVTDNIGIGADELGLWFRDFNRRLDIQIERARDAAGSAATQIADLVMEALAHEVEERAELVSMLVARTGKLSGAVTDLRRVVTDEHEVLSQLLLGASASLGGLEGDGTRALGRAMIDAQSRIAETEDGLEVVANVLLAAEAEIGGSIGSAILDLHGRVNETEGAIAAQAEALLLVEAGVGNVSAQGLISIAAAANQTGADVRLAMRLRTSQVGSFAEAGMYLEIASGVARAMIVADRFALASVVGGVMINPFVWDGTTFILNGNLRLHGDAMINGTLTGAKLVNGATVNEAFHSPGNVTVNTVNQVIAQVTNMSVVSGAVTVQLSAQVDTGQFVTNPGTYPPPMPFALYVDGQLAAGGQRSFWPSVGYVVSGQQQVRHNNPISATWYVAGLSPGPHTFQVVNQFSYGGLGNTGQAYFTGTHLVVTELRNRL